MRKMLPAAQVLVYDNYNALARSGASLRAGKRGAIVIKSISARQRPRRPAGKSAKKK